MSPSAELTTVLRKSSNDTIALPKRTLRFTPQPAAKSETRAAAPRKNRIGSPGSVVVCSIREYAELASSRPSCSVILVLKANHQGAPKIRALLVTRPKHQRQSRLT